MPRLAWLLAAVLFWGAYASNAQEAEAPPPKQPGVQITFLPPPVEGTLSLGIYNSAGKLVRVLHKEATEKDFTVGLNGLITRWDGKDDAGNPVPQGTYTARGYGVGALAVEGVAYHCNEWIIDEESPHVRRILSATLGADSFQFVGETVKGERISMEFNRTGELQSRKTVPPNGGQPAAQSGNVSIREGRVLLDGPEGNRTLGAPDVESAIAAYRVPGEPSSAQAAAGSIWVIDRTAEGVEVKQFSSSGEFRRQMQVPAGDPQPVALSASSTREEIVLIEEGPGIQRVRVLALDDGTQAPAAAAPAGTPPQSNWRTVFSRSILQSDEFAQVADKLGRPQRFKPMEKLPVRLIPNPLLKDEASTIELQIAHDAAGAFFRSADGLPLCHLTETPHLRWCVMGREGTSKSAVIFESDGAVVEEFRAGGLANMMAFDAGEYEWTPPPAVK